MKKILIILILLPFLYFSIGYYPIFLLKQQLIKKEIKQKLKENIPENELTELIFDKATYNSLKWFENKKEFSYNNHMYDVIKIEIIDENSILIQCIDDEKEKELITQLGELTEDNGKGKHNRGMPLTKLLIKDYVTTKALTIFSFYKIIQCYELRNDLYLSYITDKPSPPPKLC